MTPAQATRLLARCRETSRLTVLVHRLHDPVDARITANGLVLRVDKDDLEVFVGRVLIDPVGVQNPQIGAAASHTFFGGGLE